MKNLIGKKVRGFKFDSRDHCVWFVTLEDYIGRVGVIDQYLDMVNVFIVKYGEDCLLYPAELIEQHLVEEDTLTPQGKARELVQKCSVWSNSNDEGYLYAAKQSAFIAVDEILKVIPMYTGSLNPKWDFWQQVKTEIEKL